MKKALFLTTLVACTALYGAEPEQGYFSRTWNWVKCSCGITPAAENKDVLADENDHHVAPITTLPAPTQKPADEPGDAAETNALRVAPAPAIPVASPSPAAVAK